MKKYSEYLDESITAEILSEPKSKAAQQAAKMGLSYVGFGRYADRQGNVKYLVHNGQLVPFKSSQQVDDLMAKSTGMNPEKAAPIKKDLDQSISAYGKMRKKIDSFANQQAQMALQTDAALQQYYSDAVFTQEELTAIGAYSDSEFDAVNTFLYKGFDPGTPPDRMVQINDMIGQLDAAFEDTVAPFDYSMYTGLSSRYDPMKMLPGQKFIFRSYVSGSIDYKTTMSGFQETGAPVKVVLEVGVKQGQKSIYTEGLSQRQEFEALLPRGTTVQIVSGPHWMDEDSLMSNGMEATKVALFRCEIIDE